MNKIYRKFQRRKAFITYGFFVLAILMFIISFLLRGIDEWWCNLLMGVGASCLASVLFAIVTSIPDSYRRMKEDTDEKRAIIHGYWKSIDLARQYFEECMKVEKYDYALNQIWYLHEKCKVLISHFEGAQTIQNMLLKDESIDNYRREFEAVEKQFFVLCAEIEADGNAFSIENSRRNEFIKRMEEIVARFYNNYMKIYEIQLDEAAEIERIKFKNRY